MLPSFPTFLSKLSERLAQPPPGHPAHLTMAPEYPARQEDLSVENRNCREAGVLVLLHPQGTDPAVVLTVRREHLPDHGGQISFPGGQTESDEDLRTTALREAEEEVNLDPAAVRMIGRLTPLYIPPSNFCVHPFVGGLRNAPELRPTDAEVERVLHVPIPHLLDPTARKTELRSLHGTDVRVPYYDVSGHTVWGATAMMLAEFLEAVREVASSPAE